MLTSVQCMLAVQAHSARDIVDHDPATFLSLPSTYCRHHIDKVQPYANRGASPACLRRFSSFYCQQHRQLIYPNFQPSPATTAASIPNGKIADEVRQIIWPTTRTDGESVAKVKILFLLAIGGRNVRQVMRLVRILYRPEHFYMLHADRDAEYMFQSVLPLETRYSNIKIVRKRHDTIWGGSALRHMIEEALHTSIFEFSHLKWDYFINLSESDMPLRAVDALADFLTANNGLNFAKSSTENFDEFSRKQGHGYTFLQCERRMWRLGARKLFSNLVLSGGSDWVALSRELVESLADVSDEINPLLTQLENFFTLTLLPVETYFHTVLLNTRYNITYVDENLRATKWVKRHGCKCQHKHVVDWCGCSPMVIRMTDAARLLGMRERLPVFFARKVDPVIDQEIINFLDRLVSPNDSALTDAATLDRLDSDRYYWLNVYDVNDSRTWNAGAIRRVASTLVQTFLLSAESPVNKFVNELCRGDDFADSLTKQSESCWRRTTITNVHQLYADGLLFDAASSAPPQRRRDLVIEWATDISNATNVSGEIRLREKSILQYSASDTCCREWLFSVTVGQNFDPKEMIFRDPISHVFDAESFIRYVYVWLRLQFRSANAEDDGSAKPSQCILPHAFANNEEFFYVAEVFAPDGGFISSTRLNLSAPNAIQNCVYAVRISVADPNSSDFSRTGVWNVQVVRNNGRKNADENLFQISFYVMSTSTTEAAIEFGALKSVYELDSYCVHFPWLFSLRTSSSSLLYHFPASIVLDRMKNSLKSIRKSSSVAPYDHVPEVRRLCCDNKSSIVERDDQYCSSFCVDDDNSSYKFLKTVSEAWKKAFGAKFDQIFAADDLKHAKQFGFKRNKSDSPVTPTVPKLCISSPWSSLHYDAKSSFLSIKV